MLTSGVVTAGAGGGGMAPTKSALCSRKENFNYGYGALWRPCTWSIDHFFAGKIEQKQTKLEQKRRLKSSCYTMNKF